MRQQTTSYSEKLAVLAMIAERERERDEFTLLIIDLMTGLLFSARRSAYRIRAIASSKSEFLVYNLWQLSKFREKNP